MVNLPKIALGAWAWGNDGTFGNNLTAEGDAKWEKGTQINRPDETMIKKWLDGVF